MDDLTQGESNASVSSLKISKILSKRCEGSLSFLEVQRSELQLLRDELVNSVTDLQSVPTADFVVAAKIEHQQMIDNKLKKIAFLEANIWMLEGELKKISDSKKRTAQQVDAKRGELQQHIEELLQYRQQNEMRKQIKEIVWDIALPKDNTTLYDYFYLFRKSFVAVLAITCTDPMTTAIENLHIYPKQW